MAKFKKPTQYEQHPSEMAVTGPKEHPEPRIAEKPVSAPSERPVCGIKGCMTWYDDPAIMRRHRERQHGVGGSSNENQPKPRNAEIKLA